MPIVCNNKQDECNIVCGCGFVDSHLAFLLKIRFHTDFLSKSESYNDFNLLEVC